jgi:hypothetical protein
MSEPQLNDPVFFDDSEYVICISCDYEFDRSEYDSNTCEECENEQTGVNK